MTVVSATDWEWDLHGISTSIHVLCCVFLNHFEFRVIKGIKNGCSCTVPIRVTQGYALAMSSLTKRVRRKAQSLCEISFLLVVIHLIILWCKKQNNWGTGIDNCFVYNYCFITLVLVHRSANKHQNNTTLLWAHYSISQEICTRFLLCCALVWLYIDWFSHIHQAYFTGTVAI